MTEQEIRDRAPSGATHYFLGVKFAVGAGMIEGIKNRYKACQIPCKGERVILNAFDFVGAEPISSDIKSKYQWANVVITTNPSRILYFSIDRLAKKQGLFEHGHWVFIEDWINLDLTNHSSSGFLMYTIIYLSTILRVMLWQHLLETSSGYSAQAMGASLFLPRLMIYGLLHVNILSG